MSPSGRPAAHSVPADAVRAERERIRALLLAQRPELGARLAVGPSGALVIPLRRGGSVEIGRMRRRGTPRWVVVAPSAAGARVREPATPGAIVRVVLAALDEDATGRSLSAVR